MPVVDVFAFDTFKYLPENSSRGVFDWNFDFHKIPQIPQGKSHPERPAPTPVMLGSAFAIRKDYFFDLGGYDEELKVIAMLKVRTTKAKAINLFKIQNGENYEVI